MVRLSVDHNHHTQSNSADMTCNKKVHCLLNQRHMCSCEVCIHRLSMNKSTINRNANCATVWRMLEEEIGDERKGDVRDEYEPHHNEHPRGQLYLPISVCTQEHIHRKKFKLIKLISLGYDTQSSAFEIASTLLEIYSEFMKMVGELAHYAASQWADKWSSWSKALFQGVIFYEPVLHQALSEIIVQLKKGSREGPKSKDFTQLLQQFVHFCDEMLQPIENKPLQTLINECWTDHSTDPERPNRYYHSVPLHMDAASNELIAPPSGYNIVTPLQGVPLPVLSTSAIPTQDCTNLFAEMPFGSFSFAPQEHQNFSYSLSRPNLLKHNPITSMKHVAAMIHPPSIPSDESSMVSSDDEVQVTLTHDNLPSDYFGGDDMSSSTKIFNPLDHRSFPTSLGDHSVIFHEGQVLSSDKIPTDMRAFPFGKFKCDRTAAAESCKKSESAYQQLDLSGSHISPTYPPRFGFSSPQMPPFMTPPDFSAPSMPLFPPATENPLCFTSSQKAAASQEFISQNSGVLNLLEKAAAHPAMFGNQPKFPTLRNYTVTPTTTTSTSVQNRKKLVAHSKLRHGLQDKQTVKGDGAKLQQNFLCPNHAEGCVDFGNSIATNPPHEHQEGSNVDGSPQHETVKSQVPENHTLISDAPNMPTAGISDETSNDPCHKESDPSSCTRGSECKITGTGATLGGATKYCDCCYCEFFGNGGPTVAPTSKNYAEMRERLRQKLKQRKDYSQNGKADCHTHHGKPGNHHYSEERPLDEILSFIEGDQDRTGSGARKPQKKNKGKDEEKKRVDKQDNVASAKSEIPAAVEKTVVPSGNANKQVQNKKKKKKKNSEERNSSPNATPVNSTVKKDNNADAAKGKVADHPAPSHAKSKNHSNPAELRNGHESGALSKSSQPEKKANEETSNRKNDTKRNTGNAARAQQQHAEKKNTQSHHSASFDHVFLPKDGRDGSEMDDIEKEIDSFKRFCLDSQTKVREKKIKVNWKDFSFKKVHSSH